MSAEKNLVKFLQNPTSFKFHKIETLLLRLGFTDIRAKGSHKKFKHHRLEADIIVPIHHGDCKNFYKREIAKLLKNNNFIDE